MSEILTKKQKRDRNIYAEYKMLIEDENNSRTGVVQKLMDKYGIFSPVTIYAIIKREAEKGGQHENN